MARSDGLGWARVVVDVNPERLFLNRPIFMTVTKSVRKKTKNTPMNTLPIPFLFRESVRFEKKRLAKTVHVVNGQCDCTSS